MSEAFEFDNHYRILAHSNPFEIIERFNQEDIKKKNDYFLIAVQNDYKLLKKEIIRNKYNRILKISEKNLPEIIKWAFLLRNEELKNDVHILRFLLARYIIAKISAEYIVKNKVNSPIEELFRGKDFLEKKTYTQDEAKRLVKFSEIYDYLRGSCVNLLDVLSSYEEFYSNILEHLGITHTRGVRTIARAWTYYPFEFKGAIRTLFFSKEAGRHLIGPILRTWLESMLWSLIFQDVQSKYDLSKLKPTRKLYFKDILNASIELNKEFREQGTEIDLRFGSDSWKRIYEWANPSIHYGYRPTHSEMWFCYLICLKCYSGLTNAKIDEEFSMWRDKIIEYLIDKGKIKYY